MLDIDGCHRFRIGRHLPTVYAQQGEEPDTDDTYLAIFDSREIALAVATMLTQGAHRHSIHLASLSRLIYQFPLPRDMTEHIGMAISPEVARYIANRSEGVE